MISKHILDNVGNTPLIQLDIDWNKNINLYVKLEFYNPTGSVKDRAASYIINKLLEKKEINHDTTIIESTSGNFGIALSAYCKRNDLKFIAVIDPHITPVNEMLIRSNGTKVIKVSEPDDKGGFLKNRIKKVRNLLDEIDNSYWVNQYGNPYNAEAYYHSLGEEVCNEMESLDYIFIGVSSGGTITGVSRKIKERFQEAKVIGVDIVGSVIFGNPPERRYIPGMGSSMVPDILKHAKIDEVVIVDEASTINMCHELLNTYQVFAGGSSGSVCAAIKKYFRGKRINKKLNVVTIFPDRGERYTNTIYDQDWCTSFTKKHSWSQELCGNIFRQDLHEQQGEKNQ